MTKAKILVVDDEKEICEITKNFLDRRNYSCFTATTEKDALELVKKESPELVILDVRLGESSGLDVLSKIKSLNTNTEVIMITGLGDEETMQQAKSLGANDFITKPFSADFLNNLLAQKLADLKKAKTP